MAIEHTAYARAGLIGNPSDGYSGKCIALSVRDFAARVCLEESEALAIVAGDEEALAFPSLRTMLDLLDAQGYYGGVRLMKATLRRFARYCEEKGHPLHDRNFTLRYTTTIPRRVGLAGSSALVTAALRCLMAFYEVDVPKAYLPSLALAVETEELGIGAGLMDRVIQIYEGCVYMDLDRSRIARDGHGLYEALDPALLPTLFIAYHTRFAEGSEVFHNEVGRRWREGDPDVVAAMDDFAGYTDAVRELLEAGEKDAIGPWMDKNFDRRASIYPLNPALVDLVQRARAVGAHAKFAGSGGAVVGVYTGDAMYQALADTYQEIDAIVLKPIVTS